TGPGDTSFARTRAQEIARGGGGVEVAHRRPASTGSRLDDAKLDRRFKKLVAQLKGVEYRRQVPSGLRGDRLRARRGRLYNLDPLSLEKSAPLLVRHVTKPFSRLLRPCVAGLRFCRSVLVWWRLSHKMVAELYEFCGRCEGRGGVSGGVEVWGKVKR